MLLQSKYILLKYQNSFRINANGSRLGDLDGSVISEARNAIPVNIRIVQRLQMLQ